VACGRVNFRVSGRQRRGEKRPRSAAVRPAHAHQRLGPRGPGFDSLKGDRQDRTRIGLHVNRSSASIRTSVVAGHLKLYGSLYGLNKRATFPARMDEMSAFLGLTDLLPRITGSLPWGWSSGEPGVRPTFTNRSSVSRRAHRLRGPGKQAQFLDLIQLLSAQGTTIFVTTHHMDEAELLPPDFNHDKRENRGHGLPQALKKKHNCETLLDAFLANRGRGQPVSPTASRGERL